jgi:hypothetical protein
MRAMYFTASSWKASKPCERVWKQLREHVKELQKRILFQPGGILETPRCWFSSEDVFLDGITADRL